MVNKTKQVKIVLKANALEFIDKHKQFGYKSRTQIINAAIELLQQKLEEEDLRESARIIKRFMKQTGNYKVY